MAPRRNSYTNKFKLQAMQLADDLGSVNRASRDLSVPATNIRNWLAQRAAIVAAPRESRIAVYRGVVKWPAIDHVSLPGGPYLRPEVGLFPLEMFNDSPRFDHELLI